MENAARIVRHGSEKRQRNRPIFVRCTEAEYAQLATGAESVGLTVGAYVRMRCLGTAGPRATRRPPIEKAVLSKLLALLGRVASNLNQLTRIANTTGEVPEGKDLTLQAVKSAATEIIRALGRGEP